MSFQDFQNCQLCLLEASACASFLLPKISLWYVSFSKIKNTEGNEEKEFGVWIRVCVCVRARAFEFVRVCVCVRVCVRASAWRMCVFTSWEDSLYIILYKTPNLLLMVSYVYFPLFIGYMLLVTGTPDSKSNELRCKLFSRPNQLR